MNASSIPRVAAALFILASTIVVFGQGTPMSSNTRLEVNLGFPDLAKWGWEQGQFGYHLWYDNAHYDTAHPAMYKRCGSGLPHPDPGAPPVRTCMQQILHSYRMQGVTGVRIMFEMHHILDGPAWLTGFHNLLDDLVAAQIYYVTLTPGWGGANWDASLPNHYTVVQNPEPRGDTACTNPLPPGEPYSKPAFMRFSPTSPYGERCIQDLVNHPEKPCTTYPGSGLDWRIDGTTDDRALNQSDGEHAQEHFAYRCSPTNPYFLGWPTILNALGTALEAVQDRSSAGLRLRELDAQNELALEVFPVRGRLIVDNAQGNYDVLGGLRNLMQAKGFDPTLVTYSVFEGRTRNPPSSGVAWDCASYWGDSARIFGVSEITAAIGGGQFGNTSGDWTCGSLPNQGCGLRCGGDAARMPDALPYGHSQPKMIDLHFSPCRTAVGPGGEDCDPARWDQVNLESAKGLSGLHSFQKSFYPASSCQSYYPGDPGCGWRGYDPQLANSLLMLGEAHGHGLVPELQGNTNTQCEMLPAFPGQYWDVRFGRNTAAGFNQSTLPYRTLPDGTPLWLIVRPWEYPQHDPSDVSSPGDPYYCNAGKLDSMYIPSDGTVTNQAPAAVSVTPSSGGGASQTFSLIYSDPNTYRDLSTTYVLLNSGLSFGNGCYVEYNRTTSQLRLSNNGGTGWFGPVSLAAGGLQNSQCAIDPGGTKSETGNALTLNLPLRFFTGFSGGKNVYLLAQDLGGLSSGWQLRGTWGCTLSISPSSQTFPAGGGTGSVTVTAGPGCNWTATSNQTWVTITSGASGAGDGTVNYTVAANTTNTRQGTLTIAGQTFTITQSVPTDLYFQNRTFTSGVWLYQALNSIVADSAVTVSAGASVTFSSANFIRLGPGFQATAGGAATTFRALIDPTIH